VQPQILRFAQDDKFMWCELLYVFELQELRVFRASRALHESSFKSFAWFELQELCMNRASKASRGSSFKSFA
jgi:hypothetical protein